MSEHQEQGFMKLFGINKHAKEETKKKNGQAKLCKIYFKIARNNGLRNTSVLRTPQHSLSYLRKLIASPITRPTVDSCHSLDWEDDLLPSPPSL